jgi:hypothetical protein
MGTFEVQDIEGVIVLAAISKILAPHHVPLVQIEGGEESIAFYFGMDAGEIETVGNG